jgi:hypothetical protein
LDIFNGEKAMKKTQLRTHHAENTMAKHKGEISMAN